MHCRECGKPVVEKAEICPSCGVRIIVPIVSDKSRVTAGVLAILLGGLGLHKFYMGKAGMGILYLVFCMTFIPAIIALIEGIIYLTESDASFVKRLA